jgi:hypothetical protein
MKSKDLAKAIAVTPEHMSRLEADEKANVHQGGLKEEVSH